MMAMESHKIPWFQSPPTSWYISNVCTCLVFYHIPQWINTINKKLDTKLFQNYKTYGFYYKIPWILLKNTMDFTIHIIGTCPKFHGTSGFQCPCLQDLHSFDNSPSNDFHGDRIALGRRRPGRRCPPVVQGGVPQLLNDVCWLII
jgi:hypothetical protein